MRIVFLDTETTGLTPGNICQLSYIVQEGNTLVKRVNQYFNVGYVEEGAQKVHGLSPEKLAVLSEGKVFADRTGEFYTDLTGSLVVAHNLAFDSRFLKSEFSQAGVEYKPDKALCTMEYLTDKVKLPGKYGKYKWPSVAESLRFLGISEEYVAEYAKNIFGGHLTAAHDARYDSAAVCLMVNTMVHNGILNLGYHIMFK